MEAQSKAMNEIQFRDIEMASMNGFLGIFIHIIIVPVIFLATFVLYGGGAAGVILAILLQIIISILWCIMWNS